GRARPASPRRRSRRRARPCSAAAGPSPLAHPSAALRASRARPPAPSTEEARASLQATNDERHARCDEGGADATRERARRSAITRRAGRRRAGGDQAKLSIAAFSVGLERITAKVFASSKW